MLELGVKEGRNEEALNTLTGDAYNMANIYELENNPKPWILPLRDKVLLHRGQWSQTSGDTEIVAIANQLAVKDEFGLDDASTTHLKKNGDMYNRAFKHYEKNKKAMRLMIRAEYDATQDYLKKHGIKELTLFRGLNGTKITSGMAPNQSKVVETTLQPATSFTLAPHEANRFAQKKKTPAVMMTKVKAEDILSMPKSGSGCSEEFEVIIKGGKTEGVLTNGVIENIPEKKVERKIGGGITIDESNSRIDRKARVTAIVDMLRKMPKDEYKKYVSGATRLKESVNDTQLDGDDSLYLDEDLDNADWTKQKWDLPPYKSNDFFFIIPELLLYKFRELPIYLNAIENGKIVNDEWITK